MNEKNRKVEELIIFITVLLLFILTLTVFERILPSSFKSITGEVVTTVNITQPNAVSCNFTLQPGLNLVSFFCITTLYPVTNVVGGLSYLDAVFEYEEGSSDAWKIYNPNLPSFVVQDLEYMTRTKGYWIRMTASENFNLDGGLRIPTDINLIPGWNLGGYPTNMTKDMNTSFASISGNFTEVRTYNASAGIFISYIPGVGGVLNQTEPYKGYWINATTNEVWVVD
jgi:hypothetical protein